MKVTKKNLAWDGYGGFSGWYYLGQVVPIPLDTREHRLYAVGCKTEGRGPMAFNAYDSCGWSGGRYQVTELCSGWLLSALLGELHAKAPAAMSNLLAHAARFGYEFKKVPQGYRWCDKGGPVSRDSATARRLFGLNSNVKMWTAEDKDYAADFIVELINVWDDPAAVAVQDAYLIRRMRSFVMADAKWLLDDKAMATPSPGPWFDALQAVFLSYSLNRPATAAEWLAKTQKSSKHAIGTEGFLLDFCSGIIYGSNIGIYAKRYDDIRGLVEKAYGVDMPDYARDLDRFKAAYPDCSIVGITEVQKALIHLGYKLGPRGADGIDGEKTRLAVKQFQAASGLGVDGVVGPKTLRKLEEAMAAVGVCLLPLVSPGESDLRR